MDFLKFKERVREVCISGCNSCVKNVIIHHVFSFACFMS